MLASRRCVDPRLSPDVSLHTSSSMTFFCPQLYRIMILYTIPGGGSCQQHCTQYYQYRLSALRVCRVCRCTHGVAERPGLPASTQCSVSARALPDLSKESARPNIQSTDSMGLNNITASTNSGVVQTVRKSRYCKVVDFTNWSCKNCM